MIEPHSMCHRIGKLSVMTGDVAASMIAIQIVHAYNSVSYPVV